MRAARQLSLALALALALSLLAGGCGGSTSAPDAAADVAPDAPARDPAITVATWNLLTFSPYGPRELRILNVAEEIASLDADLVALQELKVQDGTLGEPPQAWDALLERLDRYEGVHNPWDPFDTTVGLLYDPDTVTLVATQTLFEGESYAFPRPPLHAIVEVSRGGARERFEVIVLHLKAFDDSVDRRRAACQRLRAWIDMRGGPPVLLIGDFNDDPYDPPGLSAFSGTFVGTEPAYHFLTLALPPETTTSVGYFRPVAGVDVPGEFIDHAVATDALFTRFARIEPSVRSVPREEYTTWENRYSDHFPVVVRMVP